MGGTLCGLPLKTRHLMISRQIRINLTRRILKKY